jgi:eukaryotic-like serine/threonine-protein kinase
VRSALAPGRTSRYSRLGKLTERTSTQASGVPLSLVAGKYRLTRLLGRGGMGSVWEGVHESLGTRVAVKLIDIEHVQSGDSQRRFETEARSAAKLQSKHVVEVYDYGVSPEGQPFIVMQYLAGEPLDRRLERVGRLSPFETARVVLQVCRALSRAHAVGIIHRDLKPENIFLVQDEEDGTELVKVVDFGIAKVVGAAPQDSATRTGSVLGTPYYMSPEQARGLRSVDHRSDLWSVGVIAFRCMVGRLPFDGEAVGDVLVNLCTGPIPVPSELMPDLPPGFDAFTARVLSRTPSDRFASAAELGEALAALCGLSPRVGPTTGDVPILRSDAVELRVGHRASNPGPKPETLVAPATEPGAQGSPGVSDTFKSPSGLTGSAMANTPPPVQRQNALTLIVATALVTVIIVIGIAALLRGIGDSRETPAELSTTAAALPLVQSPAPLPPPATAALPAPGPAPAPAASTPVPAASNPASTPSASVSSRPVAQTRSRPVARPRPATPIPSPQSLEIRLER